VFRNFLCITIVDVQIFSQTSRICAISNPSTPNNGIWTQAPDPPSMPDNWIKLRQQQENIAHQSVAVPHLDGTPCVVVDNSGISSEGTPNIDTPLSIGYDSDSIFGYPEFATFKSTTNLWG
jgi:hypothetical protein